MRNKFLATLINGDDGFSGRRYCHVKSVRQPVSKLRVNNDCRVVLLLTRISPILIDTSTYVCKKGRKDKHTYVKRKRQAYVHGWGCVTTSSRNKIQIWKPEIGVTFYLKISIVSKVDFIGQIFLHGWKAENCVVILHCDSTFSEHYSNIYHGYCWKRVLCICEISRCRSSNICQWLERWETSRSFEGWTDFLRAL